MNVIYKLSACNEDLTVTFKGVNGKVEYFAKKTLTTLLTGCKIEEDVDKHSGNFHISTECLSVSKWKMSIIFS
jgi:hypothetical protein